MVIQLGFIADQRWHSFAIGPAKGTIAMQRSRL
jgi:hypothetical protein